MDIISNKIVSKNVRKYRLKVGLSQDQLARKANVPYSTYLKIETGYTPNPSIQAIVNIAEALEISIESLIRQSKHL